ncbi:DUF934 domain-containing protein [Candidatus Pseudothioglobus sp. Uisw_041]|jgi:uncharacterized protein (DUF934 family)|uniref:DUF934 domain-containing protein n=1 Tax=unclassified Candidatus Pseudothioglobus TaxID=3072908 RepID=UPI0023150151|nr:DUF934 domain-containing protein [Candidatus Thioglobus sp.]MDB9975947.1 DUF934 domain-containing protein [Candidatus Thioglobus sp.]MDC1386728.1 DUF934 domain-containing protein [Candidatus Thioglobus sp.]MDC1535566.1 DUF934 domain-containing protein [Candidatus Thioglobus sp.]MDC3360408.1 DUF934 domain-containing protein [Candidatus Thioglobus sp.]|tara:strand:+ start:608 stop:1048 length:441 start_codon:yes stop_codon:yes gene_type:complete
MGEACQIESILNKDYESVDLVSFQEWIENIEKLSKLSVGVIIAPSDDVFLIKDYLDSLELIVLDFNNFDDGRGYSQAYLLRKRWQFLGEVIGINAHLDQLQFMIRSGVTSYVLLDSYIGLNEEDYANGFSICYQEAANNSGLQQKY